jgi:RHS repeat-associated protein
MISCFFDFFFFQEHNSSGVFNETYYHDGRVMIAKKDFEGISYYHPDHLGSTTLITNNTAEVIEDNTYKPYGEIITNTEERYTYTGQEKDKETHLQYYKARYYNPQQAQFTTADSIIANTYNPQNLNRYNYVLNNPYLYVDPDGNTGYQTIATMGHALVTMISIYLTANTAMLASNQLYDEGTTYNSPPAYGNGMIIRDVFVYYEGVPLNVPIINHNEETISTPGNSNFELPFHIPGQEAGLNFELSKKSNTKNNYDSRKDRISKGDSNIWKDIVENSNAHKKNPSYREGEEYTYRWDKTHSDIEVYRRIGRNKLEEIGSLDPKSGEIYKTPRNPRIVNIR